MKKLALLLGAMLSLVLAPSAAANHTALVEGTCIGPGPTQRTIVPPGTCGDYDGDGRIGVAEDTDEADRVFGTITAALTSDAGGAVQNGTVTIVESGVFPEQVIITASNGNLTLQAAPGVVAIVDAVLQGNPGNGAREAQAGIVVPNVPPDRMVTIRNIMSRNWISGYRITGTSRVTLDGVRADNSVNFGVEIRGTARVAISNASVQATGFPHVRLGGGPPVTPTPGDGIAFMDASSGTVCSSTVTGSLSVGIRDASSREVVASHNNVFDNGRNLRGVTVSDECIGRDSGTGGGDDDSVVPLPSGGPSGLVGLVILACVGYGLLLARNRRVLRETRT
jgi:hypothetical protein